MRKRKYAFLAAVLMFAALLCSCSLLNPKANRRTDPETGREYIDNQVGMVCIEGTEAQDVAAAARKVSGKVAERKGGNVYVIELDARDIEGLKQVCTVLKSLDYVTDAYVIMPDYMAN